MQFNEKRFFARLIRINVLLIFLLLSFKFTLKKKDLFFHIKYTSLSLKKINSHILDSFFFSLKHYYYPKLRIKIINF